jgi:DNA-directed RNA polymerase subunit RPC12/RpoP
VPFLLALPHADPTIGNREAACRSGIVALMNCPYCSTEMMSGVIVGRSPGVKFKPARNIAGDIGGALLTAGFFNHSAPAYRCSTCGTVVVPGRQKR